MPTSLRPLLAAVFTLWGAFCTAEEPPADAKPLLLTAGDPLPALTGIDDEGQPWILADRVAGKVLVLYLYPGDFTPGCTKQAETFREGLVKLEERGVELIGISGDEVATHKQFKEAYGLNHRLLADPKGELAQALGAPVSRGGKVRARGRDGKALMQPMFRADGTPLPGAETSLITRPVTLPRWTIIIDRDGAIASIRRDVNPATDAQEVLELVESLQK